MKINVIDDKGKVRSSIADIEEKNWLLFEDAAQKLMKDQTDDPQLAAMMLLTSFMKNVSGQATDSIFLTGIPAGLMEKFDTLLTEVGQGKAAQFLARIIAMSGQGAFHIINNHLGEGRMGHNIMFMGIPPETMERWVELAELAELETGDLLARIFVAGPSADDEQKEKFRKLQAEKLKEAEKKARKEESSRTATQAKTPLPGQRGTRRQAGKP